MEPQITFPHATAGILFVASAFVYYVYTRIGNKALVWLSLGLVWVGIESILDGFEASKLIEYAGGSWNDLPQEHISYMLNLDAVRGFFIVLWAAFEILFTAEILGVEKRWVKNHLPTSIVVVGIAETLTLNFSSITPLDKRILLSSAGRVLGILVPVAIITGLYMLKVYKELGSDSLFFFGLGFVLHGITLPTYSLAKEAGSLTLGLWYTFGGILPAFFAVLGALFLLKEATSIETGETETGEAVAPSK